VISPSQSLHLHTYTKETKIQKMHTNIKPGIGFQPTIWVFVWTKTVHVLGRLSTYTHFCTQIYYKPSGCINIAATSYCSQPNKSFHYFLIIRITEFCTFGAKPKFLCGSNYQIFWTADYLLCAISLTNHLNMDRNTGLRVKFRQQLHPNYFRNENSLKCFSSRNSNVIHKKE
jgi:hypothetical protein